MPSVLDIPSRGERWQLLERLGRGGAGETWRVRRQGRLLSDEVCVKLPLSIIDAEDRRAILEEARVLSRVRHAHVVTLLDVVEDAFERPLLVLELVRGADLKVLLRGLRERGAHLPLPVVASIGRAVGLALGALGRAFPGGAAHRDVSPHNLLVSAEGEVKLADFGIARAHSMERQTRSGRLKGKCGYVAPERVRGAAGDAKSDVFALGVVMHELLLGERPFAGSDLVSELDAIVRGARRPRAERAGELPHDFAQLLEQLLAANPRERPLPDEVARRLARHSDEQLAIDVLRSEVRRLAGPGLARASVRSQPLAREAGRHGEPGSITSMTTERLTPSRLDVVGIE